MRPKIDAELKRKPSDYSYDYSREEYMSDYYTANQKTINDRAKQRYRDNRDALSKAAREKYKPKTQRHSIYR